MPSSFGGLKKDGKNRKHNPRRVAQLLCKRREQLLLHGFDAQGIKQKKTKRQQQSHNLLTGDAIANILSWLPVESLTRFRCVCKSWCSLTYDPYFQKQQHERSARATRTSIAAANMITGDYGPLRMRMYSLGVGEKKKITDCSVKLTFPPRQEGDVERRCFKIWNSVNGLTCVYDYAEKGACFLVNPSTREVEKLPKCPYNGYTMCVGLGFDSSTGIYKALRILRYYPAGNSFLGYEILTLGRASQQWKFIREIPCFMRCGTELVFVNGAFHWMAYSRKRINGLESRHLKIFTVDIRDDKFGSMSTPVPCCFSDHRVVLQVDLEGHLLLLKQSPNQVSIWMMKDYAAREWTNTHNVNMNSFPRQLALIGIAYDNVLFRIPMRPSKLLVGKVCCFDLRRRTSQTKYWKIVKHTIFYTESLLSPRKVLSNTNTGIKM